MFACIRSALHLHFIAGFHHASGEDRCMSRLLAYPLAIVAVLLMWAAHRLGLET